MRFCWERSVCLLGVRSWIWQLFTICVHREINIYIPVRTWIFLCKIENITKYYKIVFCVFWTVDYFIMVQKPNNNIIISNFKNSAFGNHEVNLHLIHTFIVILYLQYNVCTGKLMGTFQKWNSFVQSSITYMYCIICFSLRLVLVTLSQLRDDLW